MAFWGKALGAISGFSSPIGAIGGALIGDKLSGDDDSSAAPRGKTITEKNAMDRRIEMMNQKDSVSKLRNDFITAKKV